MKTSKNYFKWRNEALNTYFSLLTIGNGGEDALRLGTGGLNLLRSFNFSQSTSKFLCFQLPIPR